MNAYGEIITKRFKSQVGELLIGSHINEICLCDWGYRKMRDEVDARIQKGLSARYVEGESPVIRKCITQLEEYLEGQRQEFDLPLFLGGTDFQKNVWQNLRKIPFGETRSYLELSRMLGNEKAIRAVAAANGANAISIIIPCHRIIGSKGELTGYAGGLATKKNLLRLEAKGSGNEQLELF
jgi:methylated-DNA-[protein]-cysteine S-methyltransferase